MKLAPVIFAVGCSGPATGAPKHVTPPPLQPVTKSPARTIRPDLVCNRLAALKDQHCGKFDAIDLGDACAKEFAAALEDASARPTMQLIGECTLELETCADVVACLGALDASPQLRGCDEHDPKLIDVAVGVPWVAWTAAIHRNTRKFSEVRSSKTTPIEVCGVSTESEWLATLACDDGSMPLSENQSAEMARVGNVGMGGRCNAIIDRYKVQCPEASYELYLDGYVCPLPQ